MEKFATKLKPIETTSVNKFSGVILAMSNLNEVDHIWDATWVEVYESAKKYYFLAGGWDEEKNGVPRFNYKAYSAYKQDFKYNYQDVAKFVMNNPNWLDW